MQQFGVFPRRENGEPMKNLRDDWLLEWRILQESERHQTDDHIRQMNNLEEAFRQLERHKVGNYRVPEDRRGSSVYSPSTFATYFHADDTRAHFFSIRCNLNTGGWCLKGQGHNEEGESLDILMATPTGKDLVTFAHTPSHFEYSLLSKFQKT
jgi:hypothetical protein